jgi:riboflavin synthase
MFSGIIESKGTILSITREGTNKRFRISAPFSSELYVDQSVAHDGVCLTVVSVDANAYEVVAIPETLSRTTLDLWKVNDSVNLERAVRADSLLDGHLVQGHVDTRIECVSLLHLDGSRVLGFRYQPDPANGLITVQKGSVTINGVSLTVSHTKDDYFEVSLIPHTLNITTLSELKEGKSVNVEFDIIGKYFSKLFQPYLLHHLSKAQ